MDISIEFVNRYLYERKESEPAMAGVVVTRFVVGQLAAMPHLLRLQRNPCQGASAIDGQRASPVLVMTMAPADGTRP
jgi:hypothetical protein